MRIASIPRAFPSSVHVTTTPSSRGAPVVASWYSEASRVLDLDGNPHALVRRAGAREADVTIGADGFSYTRSTHRTPEGNKPEGKTPEGNKTPEGTEYKLGEQV